MVVRPSAIVGWDSDRVWAGTVRATRADVSVLVDSALTDIRNCSASGRALGGAVAGIDRRTGRHGIWWFSLSTDKLEVLLDAEYILHAALDPSGRYTCYTAPPWTTRDDLGLHVLDRDEGDSSLVLDGGVARSCVPAWRGREILFHTPDDRILGVDREGGPVRLVSRGRHPAVTIDGAKLAYWAADRVQVEVAGRPGGELAVHQALSQDLTALDWSRDGRYLLLSLVARGVEEKTTFLLLDPETRAAAEVEHPGLRGITFVR